MKKYILLYKGPATPPGASHEKWPAWFGKLGEHLVDRGSPMTNGFALHPDGSESDLASSLNGYSIIQAEDRSAAMQMVKDHPYLALDGDDYTVEVFELE
jgi:YCII-related domain.